MVILPFLPLIVTVFFLALIYSIYKLVRSKKRALNYLGILPLLLFLISGYWVYEALFPFEDFYMKEWETNTNLEFPKTANFQYKNATFPDHHNSYTSTFVLKVSKEEFYEIQSKIPKENLIEHKDCSISTEVLSSYYNLSDVFVCYLFFIKAGTTVQFLEDKETIIFQRNS